MCTVSHWLCACVSVMSYVCFTQKGAIVLTSNVRLISASVIDSNCLQLNTPQTQWKRTQNSDVMLHANWRQSHVQLATKLDMFFMFVRMSMSTCVIDKNVDLAGCFSHCLSNVINFRFLGDVTNERMTISPLLFDECLSLHQTVLKDVWFILYFAISL